MSNLSLNKIQQALKNPFLVLTVVAIILAMLVIVRIYNTYNPKTISPPSPLPTIARQNSSPETVATKLPIETQKYIIKSAGSKTTNTFYVIQKNPKVDVRQEVEEWFRQQGLTDISQLKIFWLPAPGSLPVKTK